MINEQTQVDEGLLRWEAVHILEWQLESIAKPKVQSTQNITISDSVALLKESDK